MKLNFHTMKQISLRLPDELHKQLGHYCVDHEVTANSVIIELLEKFLKEDEKQPKKK